MKVSEGSADQSDHSAVDILLVLATIGAGIALGVCTWILVWWIGQSIENKEDLFHGAFVGMALLAAWLVNGVLCGCVHLFFSRRKSFTTRVMCWSVAILQSTAVAILLYKVFVLSLPPQW